LPAQSTPLSLRLPFRHDQVGRLDNRFLAAQRRGGLYRGLDKPGPYLVLMKWSPGYMSAPPTYATDRRSLVLSGTW
jgi:hypothetical protein